MYRTGSLVETNEAFLNVRCELKEAEYKAGVIISENHQSIVMVGYCGWIYHFAKRHITRSRRIPNYEDIRILQHHYRPKA